MSDNDRRRATPGRPAPAPAPPKRFYQSVTVDELAAPAAWCIRLDGRAARTPLKRELALPTATLAAAIAAEWRAQAERIDPAHMPLTRLANTAIDAVAGRAAEVRADIVAYAGGDLVCYRAEAPAGLAERQSLAWDPILAWAEAVLGARFALARGIVHAPQPAAALRAIDRALEGADPFALASLHVMTTLLGSAILALAHARGHLDAAAAWTAAHVDEDWQFQKWGADPEAEARRAARWREFESACRLLALRADTEAL